MTNKIPFFSVIIPVYNRCDFIEEAIQSVLNQSYTDFEIICVDDGSTDGSGKIIERMAAVDSRITVFTQPNRGRCRARNRGIDAAKGSWIAFLDSDDGYFQNHLEVMFELINSNKQLAGFATEMVIGGKVKKYEGISATRSETILDLYNFIQSNPISLNQFCYSKAICPELRFPDIDIVASEDFLFMRIFSHKQKMLKVNIITNYVNDHPLRSVNLINAADFVKWNTFTTDYFLRHYPVPDSVKASMQSYILLFSANMLVSSGNKRAGIKRIIPSLKYYHSYLSPLLYKALIKLLA